MTTRILTLLIAVVSAGLVERGGEQPEGARQTPVRFTSVDVHIDGGLEPLAAYQFELKAEGPDVKLVGVEGGEHAAFARPPYYDPAALNGGRIIIAAFNTGRNLPKGRTRVARIHVQITGNERPRYTARLIVAATREGKRMPADITAVQQEGGAK